MNEPLNASVSPEPVSSTVTESVAHRRRIVAIDLPTLPSDLARRRHRRRLDRIPGLETEDVGNESVVLVFVERHGRRIVKDCCSQARDRGVGRGMAMVEALALVQGESGEAQDRTWTRTRSRHQTQPETQRETQREILKHPRAGRGNQHPAANHTPDSIIVVPASPGRDAAAVERLAVGCLRFAPIVALDGALFGAADHARGDHADPPNRILLDIRGCERWLVRMGGESGLLDRIEATFRSAGFGVRTAIADGVVSARAWAGWRPGLDDLGRVGRHDHRVLPRGAGWTALDPLPVECLGFDAEILDRLHQVNVRSVGELRRLPRTALPARYGPALGRRLDQVVGRGGDAFHEAGVTVIQPKVPIVVRREFAGPVRSREAIELAVIELVEALHIRLRERGSGVRLLRVRVEPPDAEPWIDQIELARATRRPGHLWSVLEPLIDRLPLDAGVDAVELEAVRHRRLRRRSAAMWTGRHDGSTTPAGADGEDGSAEESLAAFVDLVQARIGQGAVRRADPAGGHVPEDRMRLVSIDRREEVGEALERRVCERLRAATSPGGPRPTIWLDHPRSIRVDEVSGRPVRVRWRGEDHEIAEAVGPERIGTPWWRQRRLAGRPDSGTDSERGHDDESRGVRHGRGDRDGNRRDHDPTEASTTPGLPGSLPHRSYWSVRLASGTAAWIFQASSTGGWFLQGLWS